MDISRIYWFVTITAKKYGSFSPKENNFILLLFTPDINSKGLYFILKKLIFFRAGF